MAGEPSYIGEIGVFAFNFAPMGWAFCQGQVLSIAQYSALYAVIGTAYGGNGATNFALPDFRGRIPIGYGEGPGLSNYKIGQTGGVEVVELSASQMPAHQHQVGIAAPAAEAAQTSKPSDGALAEVVAVELYSRASVDRGQVEVEVLTTLAGQGLPHNNMQPSLVLNFCICLQGIFPGRG